MGLAGVERKHMILVVVLSEVQQNGTALKDIKVIAGAIGYHRDAAIGVQFDVPRLFLHQVRDVNVDCSARCMSMPRPRTLTSHKMVRTRNQARRIVHVVPREMC